MFARLFRAWAARAPLTVTAAVAALSASAAMLAQPAHAVSATPASVTWSRLTLLHGWRNSPDSTSKAEVALVSGIVHFKGAISTTGSSQVPFVLPPALRPSKILEVSADLSGAAKGVLVIAPTGQVTVFAEKSFSAAKAFTSLDGVWFAESASSFTPLTLRNGWVRASDSRQPAVRIVSGIVHFEGAMAQPTGSNPIAFTLPPAFRPAHNVYVKVDLCYANNGRLFIQPNGDVQVVAQTKYSYAQCHTYLEGASFAKSATSFTALTLRNGWKNAPYSTSNAEIRVISGIVHFKGAIWTNGTSSEPFVLPKAFRPATNVYVPVDLCSATYGRLWIQPDGVVNVQAEGGNFGNAQCFTSLDGASFAR